MMDTIEDKLNGLAVIDEFELGMTMLNGTRIPLKALDTWQWSTMPLSLTRIIVEIFALEIVPGLGQTCLVSVTQQKGVDWEKLMNGEQMQLAP